MEEKVEDASPWPEIVDSLMQTHVDMNQKILDAENFKAALGQALSEAYEQGLEDGLRTKATGPDA